MLSVVLDAEWNMTRKSLEEKLKEIIRNKTLHAEEHIVVYMMPEIDKYADMIRQKAYFKGKAK